MLASQGPTRKLGLKGGLDTAYHEKYPISCQCIYPSTAKVLHVHIRSVEAVRKSHNPTFIPEACPESSTECAADGFDLPPAARHTKACQRVTRNDRSRAPITRCDNSPKISASPDDRIVSFSDTRWKSPVNETIGGPPEYQAPRDAARLAQSRNAFGTDVAVLSLTWLLPQTFLI
jgi:hypothetical protein